MVNLIRTKKRIRNLKGGAENAAANKKLADALMKIAEEAKKKEIKLLEKLLYHTKEIYKKENKNYIIQSIFIKNYDNDITILHGLFKDYNLKKDEIFPLFQDTFQQDPLGNIIVCNIEHEHNLMCLPDEFDYEHIDTHINNYDEKIKILKEQYNKLISNGESITGIPQKTINDNLNNLLLFVNPISLTPSQIKYINMINLYQKIIALQKEVCIYEYIIKHGSIQEVMLNKYVRTGIRPNTKEYCGTTYENGTNITKHGEIYFDLHGARDIYLFDYNWDTLKGRANKLPLYSSTGTNFSAGQKGLMSPFAGYCFQEKGGTVHVSDSNIPEIILEWANIAHNKNIEKSEVSAGGISISISGEDEEEVYDIRDKTRSWSKLQNSLSLMSGWYIKYTKNLSLNLTEKTILQNENKYYKYDNHVAVCDMLGLSFFRKQIADNHIIHEKQNRYKVTLSFYNEMEVELGIKGNVELDLFSNRIFFSKELYSFRNSVSDRETIPTKSIITSEVNNIIKENNIYNKDLSKLYKVPHEKNSKKICNKILTYLNDIIVYDCNIWGFIKKPDRTFEQTTNRLGKRVNKKVERLINYEECYYDLKNVLNLTDYKKEHFRIEGKEHHYSRVSEISYCPKHILKDIFDHLYNIAIVIIKEPDDNKAMLESIKETQFYNYITTPLNVSCLI